MADTGQHRGRPMLHSLGDELIERPYSRRNFRRSKANDADGFPRLYRNFLDGETAILDDVRQEGECPFMADAVEKVAALLFQLGGEKSTSQIGRQTARECRLRVRRPLKTLCGRRQRLFQQHRPDSVRRCSAGVGPFPSPVSFCECRHCAPERPFCSAAARTQLDVTDLCPRLSMLTKDCSAHIERAACRSIPGSWWLVTLTRCYVKHCGNNGENQ
ncbi:hypothetical protein B0G80_6880 [Paraburkholderia sp. BL6669N2]|nr:hypothetical protein B0G80_6880 [Paraburkholderia sp. BL6669N2]